MYGFWDKVGLSILLFILTVVCICWFICVIIVAFAVGVPIWLWTAICDLVKRIKGKRLKNGLIPR